LLPKKVASLSQRVVGFVVYGGALLWSLERMGVSGAVLWSAFTGFAAVGAIAFLRHGVFFPISFVLS